MHDVHFADGQLYRFRGELQRQRAISGSHLQLIALDFVGSGRPQCRQESVFLIHDAFWLRAPHAGRYCWAKRDLVAINFVGSPVSVAARGTGQLTIVAEGGGDFRADQHAHDGILTVVVGGQNPFRAGQRSRWQCNELCYARAICIHQFQLVAFNVIGDSRP